MDVNVYDTVAEVKLDRSVTNALNLECVQDLAEAIQRVRSAPEIRALVLSSANDKFFSIGFDIPQLFELSKEDFRLFYKTFNQTCMNLFTLSKPTVAAISGHAIAGGCILALCCDYRVIGEGRKLMGLNEIKLGVPVPYLADCVLQSLVGTRNARNVVETGEFYEPEKSLEMGMVDQILPLEAVLPKAIERARLLGSAHQGAYKIIKRNRVEGIETRVRAHQEEKQRTFIECWYSDETRKRLQEAIKKF